MASEQKFVRSFSMGGAFVAGVAAVPHALGLVKVPASFYWGLVGTFVSLLLWWVANGVNPDYLDTCPVDSLGGKLEDEPSGDTKGFNV